MGTLVNNAGYAQSGPVEEVTLEMLQGQFDTNLFGLIRMCQLVIPAMRVQDTEPSSRSAPPRD